MSASEAVQLTRHRVPADHSCLFTATAYLCQGLTDGAQLGAAGRKLRSVCADTVLADPDPVTRALMLGHDSVEEYGGWIRNEMHWGGEPEVRAAAPGRERRPHARGGARPRGAHRC